MTLTDLIKNIAPSDFISRITSAFTDTVLPGQGILAAAGKMKLRKLSLGETTQLQHQGNICPDWSRLLVSHDFIPEHIHQNQFLEACILGRFDGTPGILGDGTSLPCGIFKSTLQNSEIDSGCVVHHCSRIIGTIISQHSKIINSCLLGNIEGCFGNGAWVNVGIETGGRSLPLFADLSMELAEFILSNPSNPKIIQEIQDFLAIYQDSIRRSYTIIDESVCILDCGMIRSSYIGPFGQLFNVEIIDNSTLISNQVDPVKIGAASIVRSSILQEGSSVEDGAIIQSSMLFEHSYASQHGKVVDCVVGPNSGVSKGEATASFLGPFVGFHHQSLLIAAFWPRGRGNVAYGANVGSNHTSRVPDQEFWPGEGMFFGLGCTIKYPANFREAPYTIVAAGVTTLPQRMSFPFSLINEPVGYYLEVPPGFQNLIPAWGLSENYYALKRNEGKYQARNKAKRNVFDLNLFRPEILDLMRIAIQNLQNIKERKTIYLPGDINGIGKNMMTDENRIKAIAAYQFFLDLAQFRAEMRQISQPGSVFDRILMIANLEKLIAILPSLISRTESSRARDFERGSGIIDDYHLTHLPVEQDPFVLQVKLEIGAEIASVEQLIAKLRKI